MSEGTRKWTDEQRLAIRTVDQNLLVSAAAGSGKTSVLAERCAYLICDAEPPYRCDVSELLVVTFTRAAAAEMRQRIEANLRRRANSGDHFGDRRLQRQLHLLESADISTLHSFCTRVLRRHFNLVGLDPSFTTLDEADALLLRNDVCREVIQATYEGNRGDALSDFVDRYCNSDDETLRKRILRVHDLRSSTVDPAHWSATAAARLAEAAAAPLGQSQLGGQLLSLLRDEIGGLIRRARSVESRVAGESEKYAAHVRAIAVAIESWKQSLERNGFDVFRLEALSSLAGIPRLPIDKNGSDASKTLIKKLKEATQGGLAARAIRFTSGELAESARQVVAPAELLLQLVDDFERSYTDAKQTSRCLDFSDLERFTFNVLTDPADRTKPSAAAAGYRAQFKHVLVDEYQDINALQDRILQLVGREHGEQTRGNLFCVGDVKQSIYRFRLADPSQFLDRAAQYAAAPHVGRLIPLSMNFRSDPGVVDSVNAVFERLMSANSAEIEYDASHRLHTGKGHDNWRTIVDAVELHILNDPSTPQDGSSDDADPATDNPDGNPKSASDGAADAAADDDRTDREAELSARIIQQLTAADAPQRFEFGQIAILLRSKKIRAEKFANRLRQRGIPVVADSTTGFFDAVEIRDAMSLLQCLDNPRQDIPLAALLRSPLARLERPEDALATIRLAYRRLAFHEAVFEYAERKADDLARALRKFLAQLEQWRNSTNLRPLAGVLWQILQETGYLAFCSALPDGRQRVANLLSLHDRARAFGQFSKQGLRRFLQFLRALQEEDDLGLPPAGDEPGNVVQVMSIHASKGLQFPVVIVPEQGKKFNLADCAGTMLVDRDEYVALQVVDAHKRARWESMATLVARQRIRRKLLAEEMRVLYVAMTRAQHKLILTSTLKNPTTKIAEWRASWAGHRGAFPADMVHSAGSTLDWLGPAAVSIASGTGAIKIIEHSAAAADDAAVSGFRARGPESIPADIRAFRPLSISPPPTQRAIDALAAIRWQPPTLALSHIPAARAVTQLTKSGRAAPAGESPSLQPIVRFAPPLPPPRFATPGRRLTPTEVGTATHRVLQAIDLSCDASVDAAKHAVTMLVARRVITELESAAVDLEAIAWFLATPLCRRLASADVQLHRELPIFSPAPHDLAAEPSAAAPTVAPLDRVMLRGQIDVLGRMAHGLILADYKTDRLTLQTLQARVDFYRPQVDTYRRMIEAIAGIPVVEASLVFLVPRQIVIV